MTDKIHYAGIDIGSNAVRLLIKCVNNEEAGERMSKVQLVRVPIRLGEDAFTKGRIGKKKSKKLLALMHAYQQLMSIYDVADYRACATSAMRDASNGRELVTLIRKETGITIDIISGQEEAELITSDLTDNQDLSTSDGAIYVDVGGGSTELNLVHRGALVKSHSFNIGTIRQLSGKVEEKEFVAFRHYLESIAQAYPTIQIIGSGGNINKLLRLGAPAQRGKVNTLPYSSLRSVYDELIRYSSEERMIRFRLKPDRADVIIPAAEIFLLVGEILQATSIIVPTMGLSDGIVESVYKKHHPLPQ